MWSTNFEYDRQMECVLTCDRKLLQCRGRDISTCNLTNFKFDDFGFKGKKLPPKYMMFILYFILRNPSPSWTSQTVSDSHPKTVRQLSEEYRNSERYDKKNILPRLRPVQCSTFKFGLIRRYVFLDAKKKWTGPLPARFIFL
jgi:hypothetical protein